MPGSEATERGRANIIRSTPGAFRDSHHPACPKLLNQPTNAQANAQPLRRTCLTPHGCLHNDARRCSTCAVSTVYPSTWFLAQRMACQLTPSRPSLAEEQMCCFSPL
jgi:hypothetical protein